jgi:hypothetical protein
MLSRKFFSFCIDGVHIFLAVVTISPGVIKHFVVVVVAIHLIDPCEGCYCVF